VKGGSKTLFSDVVAWAGEEMTLIPITHGGSLKERRGVGST